MSRLYRLALGAFPASHRAAYAGEMIATFERALIARRALGRWSAFTFVLAACLDAVRAGLGERRRHVGRASTGRPALGYIPRDLAHAVRSGTARAAALRASGANPASHVYVIARSAAPPQAVTSAFQRAITGLYPDADVMASTVITGERLVRRGRSELVYGLALEGIASGAALMLAALGIFGVVGFMVATRTREIGIRIALGASRALVVRNVLGDAVKIAAWGVAGGLGLAFLWERETSWSSIGAVESLIYVAAVAIALGVAMRASLPAARRAAAVQPIVAMRAE